MGQVIKLLINISNDNEWVASKIEKEGILLQAVNAGFILPKHITDRQNGYDIMLLSLSLVVNMTICSAANRLSLMSIKLDASLLHLQAQNSQQHKDKQGENPSTLPAVNAFISLFNHHNTLARENTILGQDGIKKRIAEKKGKSPKVKPTEKMKMFGEMEVGEHAEDGGTWKVTESGLEWIPDNQEVTSPHGNDVTSLSKKLPANKQAKLNAQQQKEMDET